MPVGDNIFKEVYVAGTDHTVSSSGYLKAFGNLEDLLQFLASKDISTTTDLRVLHGYLTPAAVIPAELGNCRPYILIEDSTELGTGLVFDSDSDDYEELAEEIETLLASEETADMYPEMEHTFLLYGYELDLVLTINEEELDEDGLKVCKFVSEIAKAIYEEKDVDE